jgi:alpha-tubulin suppressor-like RCC1 family protein
VEINAKVTQISTGNQWATVVTENNDVYNWGKGTNGNFGDPFAKNILIPFMNENFRSLKENDHLTVVKIQSCNDFSVALMSDGLLYAMGDNMEGQCGTRENVGMITDRELLVPTQVVFDKTVKDFAIGENSMVILTDENEVYFSGLSLAYKPIKEEIPADKKVKKVSCCKNSIFILTEDNILYSNSEE